MDAFRQGIQTLVQLRSNRRDHLIEAYVKSESAARALSQLPLPEPKDPFYILTNERDPKVLNVLRKGGALLIDDLLTKEDKRELGPSVHFMDFIGVLEVCLAARASLCVPTNHLM